MNRGKQQHRADLSRLLFIAYSTLEKPTAENVDFCFHHAELEGLSLLSSLPRPRILQAPEQIIQAQPLAQLKLQH